jgi:hypothetical protein
VLVRRGITTTDVTAGQAKTQVHPLATDPQAVFAAFRAGRDLVYLIEMRTGFIHSATIIQP